MYFLNAISNKKKHCWSITHGAFGTLGAYVTPRTSRTPGTLGTN